MSRWWWSYLSCTVLLHIFTTGAQHQTFYVPNYFAASDASNSQVHQPWKYPQIHSNKLDPNIQPKTSVPSTTTSIKDLSTVTDQPVTAPSNGNNENGPSSSTPGEADHFIYREPTPPDQAVNKTTDTITVEPSTETSSPVTNAPTDDHTEMPVEKGRNMKQYSSTADRQVMQSLVHLLPTNLWLQLQQNQTNNQRNHSDLIRQALPDPVLLAEAAAQAGLPGPGPYPIPDHLWPYNPSQVKTKASTTSKSLFEIVVIQILCYSIDSANDFSHSIHTNNAKSAACQ